MLRRLTDRDVGAAVALLERAGLILALIPRRRGTRRR
jgi:hypothetical protein